MRTNFIVKNILKEEYDTKLKDFVYNYFDKKIDSGEWKWIEGIDGKGLVISNSGHSLFVYSENTKIVWMYHKIYDKFVKQFSIDFNDFKSIIRDYFLDKLNVKIKTITPLFSISETISESKKLLKKDIDRLVDVGMETSFDDRDYATNYLKNLIKLINQLPEKVILYRLIFLDSKDDFDPSNPGSHYVLKKRSLENSHYGNALYDVVNSHKLGDKPYLLKVEVDKSMIDIDQTLDNNMRYPHEQEITLKNRGKGSKILSLSQL